MASAGPVGDGAAGGRRGPPARLEAAVLFVLSALAVIPLAGLVGRSTEVLAETVGGSKGALLNATFGNMAELMIAALLILNG